MSLSLALLCGADKTRVRLPDWERFYFLAEFSAIFYVKQPTRCLFGTVHCPLLGIIFCMKRFVLLGIQAIVNTIEKFFSV